MHTPPWGGMHPARASIHYRRTRCIPGGRSITRRLAASQLRSGRWASWAAGIGSRRAALRGWCGAQVADFGLSRVYQDVGTMTGGLGTYQWMAPEVLANQRYSEKADVYSFGVVAWECCARQVPYAGLNGMQVGAARCMLLLWGGCCCCYCCCCCCCYCLPALQATASCPHLSAARHLAVYILQSTWMGCELLHRSHLKCRPVWSSAACWLPSVPQLGAGGATSVPTHPTGSRPPSHPGGQAIDHPHPRHPARRAVTRQSSSHAAKQPAEQSRNQAARQPTSLCASRHAASQGSSHPATTPCCADACPRVGCRLRWR
jgi:serine/threonine protein kinase